jgi:DNA-binding NarL/FixJ family response regulator
MMTRRSPRPAQAAPDCLEVLHREFGAIGVSLLAFHHASEMFEIVACAGRAFLSPGSRLPVGSSAVVAEASKGYRARLQLRDSALPLDRLAVSWGARSAFALPLTVAGKVVMGAVTVYWESDSLPVADPGRVILARDMALLEVLLAPKPFARRVLVCHENRLVAEGLARLAERNLRAEVTVASTSAAAVIALDGAPADVILLSDQLSPFETTSKIAETLRATGTLAPLLVLARIPTRASYDDAVEAGATGYLSTEAATRRLSETVAVMLHGHSALPRPDTMPSSPMLTTRQEQVLRCFERGLSDKEIARELGVSISTVQAHARAINSKFDVPSRGSALHKARQYGLI